MIYAQLTRGMSRRLSQDLTKAKFPRLKHLRVRCVLLISEEDESWPYNTWDATNIQLLVCNGEILIFSKLMNGVTGLNIRFEVDPWPQDIITNFHKFSASPSASRLQTHTLSFSGSLASARQDGDFKKCAWVPWRFSQCACPGCESVCLYVYFTKFVTTRHFVLLFCFLGVTQTTMADCGNLMTRRRAA